MSATYEILDRFRKPILYFPAIGQPNITAANGYVADATSAIKPLYDHLANGSAITLTAMRVALGDATPSNGMINAGESARYIGPYILWSAGPDELYGPQASDAAPTATLDLADADKSDDITNFRH